MYRFYYNACRLSSTFLRTGERPALWHRPAQINAQAVNTLYCFSLCAREYDALIIRYSLVVRGKLRCLINRLGRLFAAPRIIQPQREQIPRQAAPGVRLTYVSTRADCNSQRLPAEEHDSIPVAAVIKQPGQLQIRLPQVGASATAL